MPEAAQVTAAEIARMARVSRTTVSNWRRRHDDFPRPAGGTATRPTFERAEVEAWLEAGNRMPEASPFERIWQRIEETADVAERDLLLAEIQSLLRLRSDEGQPSTAPARWPTMFHQRLRAAVTQAAETPPPHVGRVPNAEAVDTSRLLASDSERMKELLREVSGLADTRAKARNLSESLFGFYLRERRAKTVATPEELADVMADLAIRGEPVERVLDPACGLGNLLIAARERHAYQVRGQEADGALAHLSEARLALHTEESCRRVHSGDSLLADAYPGQTFDAVLCDPPFGQRNWGADELLTDERWAFGIPPRSEPELAWAQHCLAHTRPGGRTVILMPPAVASRRSGRRIRAELVRRGVVRAVIALPAGASSPAHIPLHLWVLRRPEPGETPPTRMLMVDTGDEAPDGEPGGGARRPIDWAELYATASRAWREFGEDPEVFADEPGLRRSVPVIELLDEDVDFTPARHLPAHRSEDPEQSREVAAEMRTRLARTLRRGQERLPGDGWRARPAESAWIWTTVAELQRGGALELFQASASAPETADEEGSAGPPVLTPDDVRADRPASGSPSRERAVEGALSLTEGDVIVPAVLGSGSGCVRVATDTDAGAVLGRHLHLLRPEPGRLDPWFLAGFLSAPRNQRQAAYGSSVIRVAPKRLRLPLLPLDEQRAYGRAFRELRTFEAQVRRTAELAGNLADHLAEGLRDGTLLPSTVDGHDG